MKQKVAGLLFVCFVVVLMGCSGKMNSEYVIVAQKGLKQDADWTKVIEKLKERHQAAVVYYDQKVTEVKPELQQIRPLYVAFVDKPSFVGKKYVMDINRMSREIDDDIYVDFRWGIITGADAAAVLRLVENAVEPLVVKTALTTTTGVNGGCFDSFGIISDSKKGDFFKRIGADEPLLKDSLVSGYMLGKFFQLYQDIDPDIIFSASHATEKNLEMPFGQGNLLCKEGKLYGYFDGKENWFPQSEKRRVYFPVGNCLIGNVGKTRNSMAAAWLNSGNLTAMLAYVVPTWYGSAGWGTLKFWMSAPGRYTLSDARFLDMQAMQYKMEKMSSKYDEHPFPHPDGDDTDYRNFNAILEKGATELSKILPENTTAEQKHLGFWYDEDVLTYLGDPKAEVRLQEMEGKSNDLKVDMQINGKQCVLNITTEPWFSLERMQGKGLTDGKMGPLPFNYIFPERLNNPRLSAGQDLEVALADDFIQVYNPEFEAGKTYKVVLDID